MPLDSSSRTRAQPFVKLALLTSTALGHALAAPVMKGSQEGTDFSASRHHEEDGPRTTGQLIFDLLGVAGLVLLGGVFAGLTLALMGLDELHLQVLSSSGTDLERRRASKVLRLLAKGKHWVLVVLLLGNVIVNETLPVFLSDFGGGLAAVFTSTVLIVIFGEIVSPSSGYCGYFFVAHQIALCSSLAPAAPAIGLRSLRSGHRSLLRSPRPLDDARLCARRLAHCQAPRLVPR